MIKCHVCGTEVVSGWIYGFLPAGDKFKLGLCKKHDTPANREKVLDRWDRMMAEEVAGSMRIEHLKSKKPVSYEVKLEYMDGGIFRIPCLGYDVNNERELLILTKEKRLEFYPLQHIRKFTVKEVKISTEDDEESLDNENKGELES